MKQKLIQAVLLIMTIALVAPGLFAEKHESGDEPVVKRIFIRDGEVIEIDGDQAIEWISDGGPSLGKQTFLGVHVIDLSGDLREYFRSPNDRGVLVSEVSDETPAAKAGLRAGDVIISIAGKPVASAVALRRQIRAQESGANVEIEIIRSGNRQTLFATLDERERTLPRMHINSDAEGFRYRLEQPESLDKLREFFESPAWQTRVMKLQDCTEIQEKLDLMQRRLAEMEKQLQKMK